MQPLSVQAPMPTTCSQGALTCWGLPAGAFKVEVPAHCLFCCFIVCIVCEQWSREARGECRRCGQDGAVNRKPNQRKPTDGRGRASPIHPGIQSGHLKKPSTTAPTHAGQARVAHLERGLALWSRSEVEGLRVSG